MKVYVEVYGCTANKNDASLIKGLLKENGYQLVYNMEEADLVVILTCTVIDTTEQRMLSRLRELKESDKKVVVGGCMASVQPGLVRSVLPKAGLLKPQQSGQIVDLIERGKVEGEEVEKTGLPRCYEGVVAPVAVSEGCMFACSYCITSLARGSLRSYPVEDVKDDVRYALKHGCKEIQLTSQDNGSYGFDRDIDLGVLLREVCKIEGKYRIRVGMMNPNTVLKNLDSIQRGFDDSKMYKFLHLPVQSGDNDVLEKMDRRYEVEDFLDILYSFRERFPNVTIATDVIAGFPSETEKQFQNTLDLLGEVRPDVINITKYSARPFTKAKKMEGRVDTEVVKSRSKRLTELSRKISLENNRELVGEVYNVLIVKEGKKDGFIGRSENYKPVVVKEEVEIGGFYRVEITDFGETYLMGALK